MSAAAALDFETVLAERARSAEARLDRLLAEQPLSGEIARPQRLLQAMRHGVLNGGKRLRPFLVVESAALFDADPAAALEVAAALECVHCYSLIHDDLPAMDDDDLRRGQPTVHKAFDEAAAILAGDALLTHAFDILASAEAIVPAARLNLITGLARAAGVGGMVGGQALDLAAAASPPDEAGIVRLQAMKTGALIRYACEAGAIVGGADAAERQRLAEYGRVIGLAFQLADDLLDISADQASMGKATGKDAAAGKATLVGLHGANWAGSRLTGLIEEAQALLEPFGERADLLRHAAIFIAQRRR
jgi:farnesyl diphosphate synthase